MLQNKNPSIEIKDIIEDKKEGIYFDQMIDVIDDRIEKMPNYNF